MLGGNQNPVVLPTFHPRQRPTEVDNFSQIDNGIVFGSNLSRQSAFRCCSGNSQGPIFQFPFAKATATMHAYGQDNSTSEEWIDNVATQDNIMGSLAFERFGSHKGIKKTVEFELKEYGAGGNNTFTGTEHDSS
jgi:hypothetical protein